MHPLAKSSPIVLGMADHGTKIPPERSLALLDQFYEHGGRAFDTAHVYASWAPGGGGLSERALGAWLRYSGLRREVVVVTKGAHPLLSDWKPRVSGESARQDLDESLERLGLEQVDLWLWHRDDFSVPVSEIVGWSAEMVASGLTRAVGCSNWTVARIEEAQKEARRQGVAEFEVNQIQWNLARRRPDWQMAPGVVAMSPETLGWHRRTGFVAMAYESQGRGLFAGKYSLPEDGKESDPRVVKAYGTPENEERLRAVRLIATRTGYTPNQIALAWLWHQGFPAYAVAAPQNASQMSDSCHAMHVRLSPEDLATLAWPAA